MGKLEDNVHKRATPIYASTYGDVRDIYREKYGKKEYIGQMALALSGASSKKDKAYLAARRSIERVEKGQYKGFAAKYAAKVPEVGEQLPVQSYQPKGDVTITIKAHQVTSMKGGRPQGHREREFTATFSGSDAYAFVNEPNDSEMLADILRYNDYPEDLIDDFVGEGDYALDIYSAA